jgi:Type II restriction endonuclease EcoO109I
MITDFDKIKKIAGHRATIVCVNGCCYGQDGQPQKLKGYLKLCGQDFWSLISNEPTLYQEIIVPLGYEAKTRCDEFQFAYDKVLNRFTRDFMNEFCLPAGDIDWPKLLQMNSGTKSNWQP